MIKSQKKTEHNWWSQRKKWRGDHSGTLSVYLSTPMSGVVPGVAFWHPASKGRQIKHAQIVQSPGNWHYSEWAPQVWWNSTLGWHTSELIMAVWRGMEMPDEWKTWIVPQSVRKGDKLHMFELQRHPAAEHTLQVLSKCRVDGRRHSIGLCANRSTTDQLFLIRKIMEKC